MSKTLPQRISEMELLCAITNYRYCYLMCLMFYSNYNTYNNTGASVPVHALIFHITCVLVWSFCFVQTTSRMQNSTSSFIFISLMRMRDYMSTMTYLPFVDLSSIWANIVETKLVKKYMHYKKIGSIAHNTLPELIRPLMVRKLVDNYQME